MKSKRLFWKDTIDMTEIYVKVICSKLTLFTKIFILKLLNPRIEIQKSRSPHWISNMTRERKISSYIKAYKFKEMVPFSLEFAKTIFFLNIQQNILIPNKTKVKYIYNRLNGEWVEFSPMARKTRV